MFNGLWRFIKQEKPPVKVVDHSSKWNLTLYEVHEVHPHLREVALLSGYRPENATLQECVASLFQPTNETMNFWTHFLAAWFFMKKLIEYCNADDLNKLGPFIGYLYTAATCTLVSCMAHALSALSLKIYVICFLIDYTTVSILSFGTGLLYHAYCFPRHFEDSRYAHSYMPLCFLFSTTSALLACSSRLLVHLKVQEIMRLMAFMLPYAWATLPLLYRFAVEDGIFNMPALLHSLQMVFITIAGVLYATHLPEILAPGKFDLIGNSHNLLHIFGSIAIYMQMQAGLMDMNARGLMKHALAGKAALKMVAQFSVTTALIVTIFTVAVYRSDVKNTLNVS